MWSSRSSFSDIKWVSSLLLQEINENIRQMLFFFLPYITFIYPPSTYLLKLVREDILVLGKRQRCIRT